MNESQPALEHLSDPELLAEVTRLAKAQRLAIASLVAALGELDARRLYLGQGCSSMFTYCTHVLHLAEHAAFNRIEAARAARRFPIILALLADGQVHLSTVRVLAPHLSDANHQALLSDASHKSKRDVEQIVARLLPRPDAPPSVRKLPSTEAVPVKEQALTPEPTAVKSESDSISTPVPIRRSKAESLAPGRYRLQFTVGEETYRKLRRVQDLCRHQLPSGDPAAIFERALTLLLADMERTKLAATTRPRTPPGSDGSTRHVPAAVRRTVWARDGGRCRFEGVAGRCRETGMLEFHHVIPYARGGPTTVDNLELRCAAHNRYEAEQCFGWLVRETASIAAASGCSRTSDARHISANASHLKN